MAHLPRPQAQARVFQSIILNHNDDDLLTTQGDNTDPVIALDRYPASLQPALRTTRGTAHSVGDLIECTIEVSGVLRDKLLSNCRCRYLTLPRAFIAYHGIELGFSLTEIAHWLHRHPSSLIEAMRRRQALHRQLFTADVTHMIVKKQTAKLQQLFGRYARGRR